jgi:hypothetical protein
MRRPRSGWPIIVTVADVVAAALPYRTIVIDSQDSAVDDGRQWLVAMPSATAPAFLRGVAAAAGFRSTLPE